LNPISAAYGRVAGLRRAWYSRRPDRRRRLDRPVISVGNLVVGGSGKTPVVASIAELLRQSGERPAILSRGYGRRSAGEAVVIVSDGTRVLVPATVSGDEPQMLARALTGIPIVVSAERYEAGLVAQEQFGATVMILDDGFQHLRLARDIDLLVVSAEDLGQRVLPAGTLRESLTAARSADALLVPGATQDAVEVSARLGVAQKFTVGAHYGAPRSVRPYGVPLTMRIDGPVMAVAGIARPQRFFGALRDSGFSIAREIVFRDHHWFDERDLARIDAQAQAAGARVVMTTEKDAVRIGTLAAATPWAYLPMRVSIQPAGQFASWLTARLAQARRRAKAADDDAGQRT
jgi:tetraacyldisaccharide 4'-kinase